MKQFVSQIYFMPLHWHQMALNKMYNTRVFKIYDPWNGLNFIKFLLSHFFKLFNLIIRYYFMYDSKNTDIFHCWYCPKVSLSSGIYRYWFNLAVDAKKSLINKLMNNYQFILFFFVNYIFYIHLVAPLNGGSNMSVDWFIDKSLPIQRFNNYN